MQDAGRWLVGRNPLPSTWLEGGSQVAWGWLYRPSGSWCFRWCDSRGTRSQSSRLISSLWSWLVIQSRIPHPLHTPGSFHFPRQRRDCKLALAASSFRNRSAWGSRRNLRRCFTAIKSIWHGVSDRTAGQTQKAPDPSECPGLSSPRDWEGRIPCDPIAACGKPHVRWCGRVPGRNPQHPTRSPDSQRLANAPFPGIYHRKTVDSRLA